MAIETTQLYLAQPSDHVLLSNLLELYIHDLSAIFPHVSLGADGRFGYASLAAYWAEPDRRFAFIIEEGGHTAGFMLATRGSPAVTEPDVYDIAEFFVLRRYRRAGVGRRAARRLWQRLPGRWIVRVSAANASALEFWRPVVTECGGVERGTRPGAAAAWHVFELDSSGRVAV